MSVDKDKPQSWVKYKQSLCQTCIGTCCTMPVEVKIEDLVRLEKISADDVQMSRRKLVTRLKKDGLIISYREATQKFMLASRPNGDCLFLGTESRLCTVYAKRPDLCRSFPTLIGNRLGYCPAIKNRP
jgi:Fe-S-cluster containining protein